MSGFNCLAIVLNLAVFVVNFSGNAGDLRKRRSRFPPAIITGFAFNVICVGILSFLLSLEGTESTEMIKQMSPTYQVIYTMALHTALKFCLISLFFIYIVTLKYFWYEAIAAMSKDTKK